MSDGVQITNYPSSRSMMVEFKEGKESGRIFLSYTRYRELIEYGLKAFEQDLEFKPVDWEKKESGDYFGISLEETGGGLTIEKHGSKRVICKCCGKPIKRVRNFVDEEMEEPSITGDDVCINEFGFHDHHTGIWWQFKEPRTSPDRFK